MNDEIMDCGIQDIPTTGACSFCRKTWYHPNKECKCLCHPKQNKT